MEACRALENPGRHLCWFWSWCKTQGTDQITRHPKSPQTAQTSHWISDSMDPALHSSSSKPLRLWFSNKMQHLFCLKRELWTAKQISFFIFSPGMTFAMPLLQECLDSTSWVSCFWQSSQSRDYLFCTFSCHTCSQLFKSCDAALSRTASLFNNDFLWLTVHAQWWSSSSSQLSSQQSSTWLWLVVLN